MKEYNSESAENTRKVGEDFAKNLKGGDTILLFGNLGGGKTTFVQGLARGLGIKKRIISPTFILMRTHKTKKNGAKCFYHLDLYRIKSNKDIEGLGLEEIIQNKENIVAIEWPEKLKDSLQAVLGNIYSVYFINSGEIENERVIKIYAENK